MRETLGTLCELPGVSGREGPVRDAILRMVAPHADYHVDSLGNLIVHRRGKARARKRVLIAAHMDEVGFIITHIEESGYLRFAVVGGIDARILPGSRVLIGEARIPGVIAGAPVHLLDEEKRSTVPKEDDLLIDIGAPDDSAAREFVTPGDTAVWDTRFEEIGDGCYKGRALDDRVGCAILMSMIAGTPPFDLDFVFTVQEEVGLHGAMTAAYAVKPDLALVVDVTTAADLPGVTSARRVCALRGGAVIPFMDQRTIYDRALFDFAFDTARAEDIPCQTKSAVTGGNDAGAIHRSRGGVRTLNISVPGRYLHAPASLVSAADVEATARLLSACSAAMASGAL